MILAHTNLVYVNERSRVNKTLLHRIYRVTMTQWIPLEAAVTNGETDYAKKHITKFNL